MHQRFVRFANLNKRDDLSASRDVIWLIRHPRGNLTRSGWLREQHFCVNSWATISGGAGPPRQAFRCRSLLPGAPVQLASTPPPNCSHRLMRSEAPSSQRRKPLYHSILLRMPSVEAERPASKTLRRWKRRWKVSWISLADQKRGFDGVLWYLGMSRVVPGCPQTTPRAAREASCI